MPKDLQDLSHYLMKPEKECVQGLLDALSWDAAAAARVEKDAEDLITAMRAQKRKSGSIEHFFQTYSLNTQEGIALMCLAEALLRIPDARTAGALIRDKIARTKWVADTARGDDWMMRMAGMGLSASRATLEGPLSKLGEPLIRKALSEAMKILGGQFVVGQSIGDALKNAAVLNADKGYLFSFDMLGEGARTAQDAESYFKSYEQAIAAVAENGAGKKGAPYGISVKLSALHPRFCAAQEDVCIPELSRKLSHLAQKAAAANLCLTVDAEESERLETTLKIIRPVIEDVTLKGWNGFGLAVQSYGKRTLPLTQNLIELAQRHARRIQIRLVKGAYWDSEIKRAQMKGLDDYPVFTRKSHTDLSYLACARVLLQGRDFVYPMFGTHNAHTVRAVIDMAGNDRGGFEFQKLYGMGDALYDHVRAQDNLPVRVYAPVGVHRDLLPYLVRRLLENGANSSFVNKAFDPDVPASSLARDPVETVFAHKGQSHPSIRLPARIFPDRLNSRGMDLDDLATRKMLGQKMEAARGAQAKACVSIIGGLEEKTGPASEVRNPADTSDLIGLAHGATAGDVDRAYAQAGRAFDDWKNTPATKRAAVLNKIADLYEQNAAALIDLCVREAGKTLPDAAAEVREAADFCRYYAAQGGMVFNENGENLRSYTGESNKIMLQGRGVFCAISPWNFPLAIFTGQVAAALMAGNTVVAKPAEQTPFTAQAAVRLMHKAGIPQDVLHLIVGNGDVGEAMVRHKDCAGVVFTGSTAVARIINQALAAKDGPIVPLIAETGGVNALVADSSALPEQVVDDVILSAFGSAGQRCSAARVLFVQEDVAEKTIAMLQGAMAELRIGDPQLYTTDVGPLIDDDALAMLQKHKNYLDSYGTKIAEVPLPDAVRGRGHYFAPIAYEIDDLATLPGEVFGPALHVIRYKSGALPDVLRAINATGYGLTFGIHTRVDAVAAQASSNVAAGNVYINRSIIGAVVGVQPFGGQGLSGTGPKAGGPHYLPRFATEKTVSVNTTAAGGNASLVMLEE